MQTSGERIGLGFRGQDWDNGTELGVAHVDVGAGKGASPRGRAGNKESAGGREAEGHPLKETERGDHCRRHQRKRVSQGGGGQQG